MNEGIREHLKRHQQLLEYDFYGTHDMDMDSDEEVKRILGEEDPEAEVDPEDEENTEDEEGGEDQGEEGEEGELGSLEDELGSGLDSDEEAGDDELGGEEDLEQGMEDEGEEEVEGVDVTELVKYAEEAKETAEQGNEKVEQLFSKFEELEDQLQYMDKITNKIEHLEDEIEKRNPTDEEQMEMRSFDSYPYNLKLTDYWSEKTGYEATEDEDEMYDEEDDEYTLTVADVENDYSEEEVKRSLEKDEDEYNSFPFNL